MQINITDSFWNRIINLAKNEIIPYQWEVLNDKVEGAEPSRCIRNFRIAAGTEQGEFYGFVFQDSDLYKWIEAASFSLISFPDPKLEAMIDSAIELIAAAQQPDGYLNTYFTIKAPESRFSNLREAHELYCAGHLFEAAAAHFYATGKKSLLDVAVKFADLIDKTFGIGENKIPGYPGHEEIELALVKLYNATSEKRYLKLAEYFIAQRGKEPFYFEAERENKSFHPIWDFSKNPIERKYTQSHAEVEQQDAAAGHAVRAMYLYSAMADLAAENPRLLAACKKLYENTSQKQMYITGGIGSTVRGEAFTSDYDLPPDLAYGETCAAIGLMMFCKRMNALTGEAKYIDTLERALYNGVISGVSLSGREFFYVNPLSAHTGAKNNPDLEHVKITRKPWFACACCPPNLARTVLNLGDYAYSADENSITVNLYISGEITDGERRVIIKTDYPYGDKAEITAWGDFTLKLRVPNENRYIEDSRSFNGETITIPLDTAPRLIFSHPDAYHTRGMAALTAGTVVYCAEGIDNPPSPDFYSISKDAVFEPCIIAGLPEGTPCYKTKARKWVYESGENLYTASPPRVEEAELVFIPYHLWGNRGENDMRVWINL